MNLIRPHSADPDGVQEPFLSDPDGNGRRPTSRQSQVSEVSDTKTRLFFFHVSNIFSFTSLIILPHSCRMHAGAEY